MSDQQGNQYVKDILEDIKKAISNKNPNDDKVEVDDESEDVLYLEEEYLQDTEEDIYKNNKNFNYQNEEVTFKSNQSDDYSQNLEEEKTDNYLYNGHINNHKIDSDNLHAHNNDMQLDIHSQNLKEEEKIGNGLHSNGHISEKELHKMESNDLQTQNNDHLILKENIKEIKALLGKVQNELQQQQQNSPSDYNLTVGELVTSLLKPELSEWLNKHLYKLVKEVVEKELKDIINNNK